jgi:hypothetical protein
MALFDSCKEIAYKIRTASCDKMACFNEFGDEQLAIDILANNVLFQVCAMPRLLLHYRPALRREAMVSIRLQQRERRNIFG